MKKTILKTSIIAFCSLTFLFSCKKKDSTTTAITEEVTEAKMHSDDNSNVDGETDNVDDDINNTVASSQKFCGPLSYGTGQGNIPFDLDTTNTGNTATTIVLTFNGRGIPGTCKKRTGTVTIELLNKPRWVEQGAVLKYTFNNLKITDSCRNRSVTLNGVRLVTNVNGGNLYRLKTGGVNSLVHSIRTGTGGISAMFQDSLNNTKTAIWNVAKKHTITASGLALNLKVEGDTTLNGINNTSSWGTTRNNKNYQSYITTPIQANTNCRVWRPNSGVATHTINNGFTSTVTYGVDASGNPSSLNCTLYFKVNWTTSNGVSGSSVIPYR